MSTVRQALVVAIALSAVAFTSTAMAGKNGVPGSNGGAPGQVYKLERSDSSLAPGSALPPGQAWKSRKNDPSLAPGSALSPGQQFKQSHWAFLAIPFLAACPSRQAPSGCCQQLGASVGPT